MIATGGVSNWRAAGACLTADPDLFFPISPAGLAEGQVARAKAICAGCEVRRECLEFALAHEPATGYGAERLRKTGSVTADASDGRRPPRRDGPPPNPAVPCCPWLSPDFAIWVGPTTPRWPPVSPSARRVAATKHAKEDK